MNIRSRLSRRQALTLIEVLALLAVVILLVAVILPMFAKGRVRSGPNCVSVLKQVGLAARMWSSDHNERFPWNVSTNEGGTKEFQSSPEVFRHFIAMSIELSSPQFLRCPHDTARTRANSFSTGESVANKNISYFVGLDADGHHPQRLLSGDRDLVGGTTDGHLFVYSTNSNPGWGTNIHRRQGNIALADGSVQQLTSNALASQMQAALATMTNAEMRLSIPRVAGE